MESNWRALAVELGAAYTSSSLAARLLPPYSPGLYLFRRERSGATQTLFLVRQDPVVTDDLWNFLEVTSADGALTFPYGFPVET